MVWCKLRNIPCIHPEPDGLENCRYCEKYSFEKYLEYKKKSQESHMRARLNPKKKGGLALFLWEKLQKARLHGIGQC
jgi:hypothetical protein|nr:MAG TPA: hypothetical protein [Herelleviridae sp.]